MTVLSLAAAQRLIISHCPTLPPESVPLAQAAGRIAALAVKAGRAVPAFPRSSMDGFAFNSRDLKNGGGETTLPVSGEIAAGATELPRLGRGLAIAVMTGAAIPHGADQVAPFEHCRREGTLALIAARPRPGAFIRAKGADLARGRVIVRAGEEIKPQRLPLLAESGAGGIPVTTRPEIALLSTGSELLNPGDNLLPGQIIGGNRFLLAALLNRAGAAVHDCGLVADDCDKISARLAEALAGPSHAVITTGGMGPGNYDLMPLVFARLGIKPLYTELAVRPGRATLFGLLGGKAAFALPGPPPAVFLLFHELVFPGIMAMQGRRLPLPPLATAVLQEELALKKTGLVNLKGAVASLNGNSLAVRPAGRIEPANAIIHLPANRKILRPGERVRVRLVDRVDGVD